MSETRFSFGKNWENYLKGGLNKGALENSLGSLKFFLGNYSVKNKTFLDFGCGSGIHSLAALMLGAEKVVSIDIDERAVKCCEKLRGEIGCNYNWETRQGSLLDREFISRLGVFDIVYCWGVAHHTGNMRQALENLEGLIAKNGLLYLAIYNRVEGRLGSKMWWRIKYFYNKSNFLIKKIMEWFYLSLNFIKIIIHLKNPFKFIKEYNQKRGMAWKTDLVDWLGGFPYEYATPQEIFKIYHGKYGLELVNLKTTNYSGCNQYLFLKR